MKKMKKEISTFFNLFSTFFFLFNKINLLNSDCLSNRRIKYFQDENIKKKKIDWNFLLFMTS